MKALFLSFIFAVSLLGHPAFADDQPVFKVTADCVGDNRFIYHEHNQLIPTTTFLPAGGTAEFVLKARSTRAQPIM
jgi:hypothetical protein